MQSLADDLRRFLDDSQSRELAHAGARFRYRVLGTGPLGLLLLPGAVGDGESYFALAGLAASHRLVAIAYPHVGDLDTLVDGLAAILDREGLATTDVAGGSFGGLVAQAFLRRFPARTRRVVLSVTGPADPARAASNEKWARRLGRWPLAVTRALLRAIVRVTLKRVPAPEDRAFWRGFYGDAIARTTKTDVRTRYELSAALDRAGPPSPADLAAWQGTMLILEGDADKIAGAKAREALKAIYPGARVHTFAGQRPRRLGRAPARVGRGHLRLPR